MNSSNAKKLHKLPENFNAKDNKYRKLPAGSMIKNKFQTLDFVELSNVNAVMNLLIFVEQRMVWVGVIEGFSLAYAHIQLRSDWGIYTALLPLIYTMDVCIIC